MALISRRILKTTSALFSAYQRGAGTLPRCARKRQYALYRTAIDTKKEEQSLKDADITVWFSVSEGSTEEEAVKLAKESDLKWTYPECYNHADTSNNVKTITRKSSCNTTKNASASISAKLSNGSSSKVDIKFEPTLVVKVYNTMNNSYYSEVQPINNYYGGNNIKIVANTAVTFNGSGISSTTGDTAILKYMTNGTITVKTSCGQTKTIQVNAVIN